MNGDENSTHPTYENNMKTIIEKYVACQQLIGNFMLGRQF